MTTKTQFNPKKRIEHVMGGVFPDRVPFAPAIYEHAAFLIGKTPSVVAQDIDLIVKAHMKAYDTYGHDLMSTGIDIYGVEAQAMGCEVDFPNNSETPSVTGHLLAESTDLRLIKIPDPEKTGRMPLYLEGAQQLKKIFEHEVLVSGTVVGPFTLAALIRGFENIVMDIVYQPEFYDKLMELCLKVTKSFGDAFIKRGVGITINESWCSPPLVSPSLYKSSIKKYHKALIDHFKTRKVSTALIIGGDTQPIFDQLIDAGSSILIADYGCDVKKCKELAIEHGITLRANVDPKLVYEGPCEKIYDEGIKVLEKGAPGGRFILGMGVVPYDTSVENVLALKKAATEWRYE